MLLCISCTCKEIYRLLTVSILITFHISYISLFCNTCIVGFEIVQRVTTVLIPGLHVQKA